MNITGFQETDAVQAATLKASMKDRALASSVTAGADLRGVFVASALDYERDAGALSGRWSGRRLAVGLLSRWKVVRQGNAAAQNTAVVVLYQPCGRGGKVCSWLTGGNNLKADVTKDRVQSASVAPIPAVLSCLAGSLMAPRGPFSRQGSCHFA